MIKKILFGVIAFTLICIGAYVYVVLKNSKLDSTSQYEVVESKLPIEHYLVFKPKPTEKASEVIKEIEKPKDASQDNAVEQPQAKKEQDKQEEKNLNSQILDLQKNAVPKQQQFTMEEVFPKQEQKEEEREFDKTRYARTKTPLQIDDERKKSDAKMVVDYGADSIKGEEGFKATNENKLYRTIISMDRIPVIITQKIISTLGGNLVGQVRDNVYSYMGRAVLIPKGSKIEGKYANNNKIGEDRLQIVWERIVTPNGVNIRLLGRTLDKQGASGAVGEVDNRYWDRYGMPLTITTATNLGMLAVSNLTQKIPSVQSQDILEQGASDVSNIGKAILQEQIKINPIITIEAGDIVFVSPTKDIYFPKPKEGEILVEYFDRLKEEKNQDKEEEQ